jgi:plastocyanin
MLKKVIVLLAVLALTSAACGEDGNGESASSGDDQAEESAQITVKAFDFGFEPATISLDAGEEVELTFDNTGDAPHTFTSDDLGVDIRTEGGGDGDAGFTAPEDGTYFFQCAIHPDQMQGEVIVGTGGGGGGMKDTDEGPAENDTGVDY